MGIEIEKLQSPRASFTTHFNYIQCLARILSGTTLSINKTPAPAFNKTEVNRFNKLENITDRSIKEDIGLSAADNAFAVIAAPWFGVKCYYSLYYLESILLNVLDGTTVGFSKGGHRKVRTRISQLLSEGGISFSDTDLNATHSLYEISAFPPIRPGANARSTYWLHSTCPQSVLKKLMEYVLHDQEMNGQWNLRKPADRLKKKDYITKSKISLVDFFYWYRIKANYRDLDYIDFENGITEAEVFEYMAAYYKAYSAYRKLLVTRINALLR